MDPDSAYRGYNAGEIVRKRRLASWAWPRHLDSLHLPGSLSLSVVGSRTRHSFI